MSLKWSTAMSTGVRQIDLQHQELIEIINALEAAHAAGEVERAVAEILPRLAAYVMFHFGTEEAMMASLDHDGGHVAAHMNEHREFAGRVKQLAERPLAGDELPGLVTYLNGWLVGHIMRTDRELGSLVSRLGEPQGLRGSEA